MMSEELETNPRFLLFYDVRYNAFQAAIAPEGWDKAFEVEFKKIKQPNRGGHKSCNIFVLKELDYA